MSIKTDNEEFYHDDDPDGIWEKSQYHFDDLSKVLAGLRVAAAGDGDKTLLRTVIIKGWHNTLMSASEELDELRQEWIPLMFEMAKVLRRIDDKIGMYTDNVKLDIDDAKAISDVRQQAKKAGVFMK